MQLHLKAYAKVNLALDVLGRREDGYHEVRMIMQSIKLYDQLSMQTNNTGNIILTTSLPFLPVNEKNLVYRAIDLIRKNYNITEGVTAHIEKYIPVAAGMAGGSTDAAAALVGMNQLFHLGITQEKLMEYGLSLGADIPFCIVRGTALSEGIGEILTQLPSIPPCWLLIVKPTFPMSTKTVYENLDLQDPDSIVHPDIDGMIEAIEDKSLSGIISHLGNVLEPATGTRYEDILKIKAKIMDMGAEGALMTGSGSTVFGIFTSQKEARKAASICASMPNVKQTAVVQPFNKTPDHYTSRKKGSR